MLGSQLVPMSMVLTFRVRILKSPSAPSPDMAIKRMATRVVIFVRIESEANILDYPSLQSPETDRLTCCGGTR